MNTDARVLLTSDGCEPRHITLVVFAPFGSDDTLSRYPDDLTDNVKQHPLVLALIEVAAAGVNVCALVDRVDDDSWRIDIPAGGSACFTSMWKQRMSSPRSLAGLLAHAMRQHPGSAIVLSMEGHGAGYLPEIDTAKLAQTQLPKVNGERVYWVQRPDDEGGAAIWDRKGDSPPLPMNETLLPDGRTPGTEIPMSSWGLGWALEEARRRAGGKQLADKIAVVHFNNCFNFSTELLHTIAPHAEYATGYSNYNFFTAGRSYPDVFSKAQKERALSAEALARALCEGNRDELSALARPHPTVGGMVALHRLAAIADAVDKLAKALIAALPAQRPEIAKAIHAAQQFDADASFVLETPDSLTDLASLALAAHKAGRLNEVLAQHPRLAGRASRHWLKAVLGTAGDALPAERALGSATTLLLRWGLTQLRPDRAPTLAGIERDAWLDRTSWRPLLAVMCHYGFEPVPPFRDRYHARADEAAADVLCGLWSVGPSTFYRYLDKGERLLAQALSRPPQGPQPPPRGGSSSMSWPRRPSSTATHSTRPGIDIKPKVPVSAATCRQHFGTTPPRRTLASSCNC